MKENTTNDQPHPCGCLTGSSEEISRRKFLERLSIGLGGLCSAIIGLPLVGFVVAPIFKKTEEVWRDTKNENQFKRGETVPVTIISASPLPWAGGTKNTAVWLRRNPDGSFIAFSVVCTHLGCPVRWLQDAKLFMCPCHGGVYYEDGSVAGGPPPHPLPRYQVRVQPDGMVQVMAQPVPLTTIPAEPRNLNLSSKSA